MLLVGVAQMYTGVYSCNVISATKIFRYQCSTVNNSAQKTIFSTTFGDRFGNLLRIKCENFCKTRSYLTFLFYTVQRFIFVLDTV